MCVLLVECQHKPFLIFHDKEILATKRVSGIELIQRPGNNIHPNLLNSTMAHQHVPDIYFVQGLMLGVGNIQISKSSCSIQFRSSQSSMEIEQREIIPVVRKCYDRDKYNMDATEVQKRSSWIHPEFKEDFLEIMMGG